MIVSSKEKLMLEGVQRRATRFISDYPYHTEYKERLIKLKNLALDVRRNMKDLLFFFKCRIGFLEIQLSDYCRIDHLQNRPTILDLTILMILVMLNVELSILKIPIFLEL